jgi:4-carboxymuconolactone decarboxylase
MHVHSPHPPNLKPIVLAVACCGAIAAGAQDRMPPLTPDQLTTEQRSAVEELRRVRGIELRGPWIPMLRSPEVLSRSRAMGDYLRYESALPPELSEFLILLTAGEWRQQYEWHAHSSIALEAGISADTLSAIAEGRRPTDMTNEQAALYALFNELHDNHSVSDATYATALDLFGERGVIDAVGIVGYYTLLAMVMNTTRTPLPAGASPGLPSLP